MFKILFIHHGSVPGGAPTSLKNLVVGLKKNGSLKIDIACASTAMMPFFKTIGGIDVMAYTRTSLSAGRWFIWGGTNIRLLKATLKEIFLSPLFILKEIKFIKEKNPAIVHLNSSILWTSAIAASILRIPIVWHDRETFEGGNFNIRRSLYTSFIKSLATKVICIGPQEFKKIRGLKSNKVELVYNSLDNSFFDNSEYNKRSIRQNLGLPQDAFIYLSLGGDSFRKGTYQLIESINYLDHDDILILAGNPPKKSNNSIEKLTNLKLKFEDRLLKSGMKHYYSWHYADRVSESMKKVDSTRIIFPGILDDVKNFIKACDVLIFAGTTPHSARPVYEAWALRKPVIVFDSEVIRKDLDDGVDGIIVKNHTAEALAEAIKYLKTNPAHAKEMGEKGFEKSVKRFSLEINTKKILDIYRKILSEDSI